MVTRLVGAPALAAADVRVSVDQRTDRSRHVTANASDEASLAESTPLVSPTPH